MADERPLTADGLEVCLRQQLGAECLLTGIQPADAQTLVELGVDLSSITTVGDLPR